MKVLFINMSLDGHHLDYINALCKIDGIDPIVVLEKETNLIDARQIVAKNCVFGSTKLRNHMNWIKHVQAIADEEKPDRIHFIWGDSFYRFFGIGFWKLCRKYKCYITFHQVRKSRLHQISIKIYSNLFDKIIVHTDSLTVYLKQIGIKNIVHVEYPNFKNKLKITGIDAKKKLGIETSSPILLSLGGTRIDKGLDILLDALKLVDDPFYLLIAGAEQNIKSDIIQQKIEQYKVQVKAILRYLSVEEVNLCLAASDYIVLPYRKTFDGASGPLAEGVGYGKCIIGANHGSLGRLISKYHLGYEFESENIESLAETLKRALNSDFKYDDRAKEYQKLLTITNFQEAYRAIYLEE